MTENELLDNDAKKLITSDLNALIESIDEFLNEKNFKDHRIEFAKISLIKTQIYLELLRELHLARKDEMGVRFKRTIETFNKAGLEFDFVETLDRYIGWIKDVLNDSYEKELARPMKPVNVEVFCESNFNEYQIEKARVILRKTQPYLKYDWKKETDLVTITNLK